jgi:hypothetical protein
VLINSDLNLDIELGTFARNIKKEVCGVISFFVSFKPSKLEHNMLYLVFNSKFKSLKLIFSFIGCEQQVAIIE